MRTLTPWLLLAAACSHPTSSTESASSSGESRSAGVGTGETPAPAPASAVALTVTSSAFTDGQAIPRDYTCEGPEDSPPLAWSGAPAGTRSFAVIVDDPDAPDPAAPQRTWVHWVIAQLPATVTSLARAAAKAMPDGAVIGKNDWGKTAWGGPCPPVGRHRYFFKVYALDTALGGSPTKAELEQAMSGHVLAQGQLIGTYQKP